MFGWIFITGLESESLKIFFSSVSSCLLVLLFLFWYWSWIVALFFLNVIKL